MHITTHTTLNTSQNKKYTHIHFDTTHTHTELVCGDGDIRTLAIGVREYTASRRTYITAVRRAIREAQAREIEHVAFSLSSLKALTCDTSDETLVRIFTENVLMAGYEFRDFKTPPKGGWHEVRHVALVGDISRVHHRAMVQGKIIGEEVNACRTLANTPGGDMTPALLARAITRAAKGTKARVRVLTVTEMKRLGMGAILGVAKGAKASPRFIIVEYKGDAVKQKPIVFAGKGVTFDTGGLSIKPSPHMLDMHLDMSGGAAVAHAVIAAARLSLPVHAIALIPAAENAIGNESYRPGDIVRAMNGTTIEVLNTDAEGRVVLADALVYAQRYKPSLVVDVATLTGASLVALGTKASAVLSKDATLSERIMRLGEESGDYCWHLPLWDEYKEMVKGRFGDVSNIPVEGAEYGGVIGGGMFLAEFIQGYPWVHIDMAPRMVSDKSDFLARGAAGAPVRLLVRLLEEASA